MLRITSIAMLTLMSALVFTGCSTVQISPTGRVATDQLLNTLTMEDAVSDMKIGGSLSGRKVAVDLITPGVDKDYLQTVLSAWIVKNGGIHVPSDGEFDLTLHVLAQATGSDMELSQWFLPIVFPSLQNGLSVTQIDFYKSQIQVARCRLWAYGTDKDGKLLFSQPPVFASHYVKNREVFGVSLGKSTDIGELRHVKSKFSHLHEVSVQ